MSGADPNRMGEQEAILQTAQGPVTRASLCRDLEALGVRAGMTLMVHASLSRLGWVAGGPAAVILALEDALGAEGTLMMPAHSGDLSEPSHWCHPPVPEDWWPVIRAEATAFQTDLTPTRGMGVIAETFRRQAGTLRSQHPQLSFAARGPRAGELTRDHALTPALGEESPLARLYALDGWVLFLGTDHNTNTSLHLAEVRARLTNPQRIQQGSPVLVNGERRWVTFEDFEWDSDDFAALGAEYVPAPGDAFTGRVGLAQTSLLRQRPMVDFAVGWMESHRR